MYLGNHRIQKISLEGESENLIVHTGPFGKYRYEVGTWRDGMRLFRIDGERREEANADLSLTGLVQFSRTIGGSSATAEFVAGIPADVLQFAQMVGFGQLQVLQLFSAAGKEAAELAEDAFTLVWVVAGAMVIDKIELDCAAELLRGKRINIARLLNRSCSRSHVKMLSNTQPAFYSHKEYRLLYQLVKNKVLVKYLNHLERIILPKVETVLQSPDIVKVPYVQKNISDEKESIVDLKIAKIMSETCLHLGEEAGVDNVSRSLASCRSLAELISMAESWHARFNKKMNEQEAYIKREQEVVGEFNRKVQAEKSRQMNERRRAQSEQRKENSRKRAVCRKFPDPPIPGNQHIVPLVTYEELKREGDLMDNCVKSYAGKIRRGHSYIYSVYYPQRCTLEICGKGFRNIGELKARGNKKPLKHVLHYVRAWMRDARKE